MSCGTQSLCWEVLLQLLAIGLSNGAVIALNAIGVTLVYGAVRTINFAHGDLFALSSVLVTFIVAQLGLRRGFVAGSLTGGLLLCLGAALLFGALLNVGIERAAFRPFRDGSRIAPLIASVGISFILYQVALIWRKLQPDWHATEHRSVPGIPEVPRMSIPELLSRRNLLAGSGLRVVYTVKDLLVLVVAAGLALAVGLFLRRTRGGRAVRACAQDPELAELCGVDRDRAIRLAFAVGGALAGAAAFVFSLYYDRPFGQHGVQSGLVALTAAVFGGIGRPMGAFWSGLLLGVLAAFSDYFLQAQWTPVLVLLSLIVLLVLRPAGLLGEERREEPDQPSGIESGPRSRPGGLALYAPVTAVALLAVAYPTVDRALGLHFEVILVRMMLFMLLALGLNIVLGFAGMLDLGYAACFVIGAYTAAALTDTHGPLSALIPRVSDVIPVLIISAAVAGLFGAAIGALGLRLRSDYLAIVTLAFGQIVPQVLLNLHKWTGGAAGMAALPPPRFLFHTLRSPAEWYYLALVLVALAVLASVRVRWSRVGRAWQALSEDETAAVSSGVDPLRAKTTAFFLGAGVAGVAGTLFATVFGYVDPGQSDFTISAMILAMVVVGGTGSVRGALVGAALVGGYDTFGISLLGTWLDRLQHTRLGSFLPVPDLRALSVGTFGLVLYLTILVRARKRTGARPAR